MTYPETFPTKGTIAHGRFEDMLAWDRPASDMWRGRLPGTVPGASYVAEVAPWYNRHGSRRWRLTCPWEQDGTLAAALVESDAFETALDAMNVGNERFRLSRRPKPGNGPPVGTGGDNGGWLYPTVTHATLAHWKASGTIAPNVGMKWDTGTYNRRSNHGTDHRHSDFFTRRAIDAYFMPTTTKETTRMPKIPKLNWRDHEGGSIMTARRPGDDESHVPFARIEQRTYANRNSVWELTFNGDSDTVYGYAHSAPAVAHANDRWADEYVPPKAQITLVEPVRRERDPDKAYVQFDTGHGFHIDLDELRKCVANDVYGIGATAALIARRIY